LGKNERKLALQNGMKPCYTEVASRLLEVAQGIYSFSQLKFFIER
jgi:hypothetical protein